MTDNTVTYQPTLSNANESREKALKALEKAKIRYLALLKKSGSGYFKNIQ